MYYDNYNEYEDDFEKEFFNDEEYFKELKQSTQSSKKESKSKQETKSKQINQRKQDPFLEYDEESNSIDLKDDYYGRNRSKKDKYDDYEEDDDAPINPIDECEEEPEKKPKTDEEKANEENPKRKNIVRNPRVLLNEEKLKSSEGVIKLPELFKDFEFKGKNHEKDDLNRLMSVYQNWSHRLMPSLQFDDFIEKSELLCRKAKMKVFNNKIRNNMTLDIRDKNEEVINQYDSDEDNKLIDQQLNNDKNVDIEEKS